MSDSLLDDLLAPTEPPKRGRGRGRPTTAETLAKVEAAAATSPTGKIELPDVSMFFAPVGVSFLASVLRRERQFVMRRLARCPVADHVMHKGKQVPVRTDRGDRLAHLRFGGRAKKADVPDRRVSKPRRGRGRSKPDDPPEDIHDWLWGLRKQVSLLLDHGHSRAGRYPVGMLQDEAGIVIERMNNDWATAGLVANAAHAATKSKKAVEVFSDLIARLTGGRDG